MSIQFEWEHDNIKCALSELFLSCRRIAKRDKLSEVTNFKFKLWTFCIKVLFCKKLNSDYKFTLRGMILMITEIIIILMIIYLINYQFNCTVWLIIIKCMNTSN